MIAKNKTNTHCISNILATISDRKIGYGTTPGTLVSYWSPDIYSASDYYPFGWTMPGRVSNGTEYRYSFNTQEKSDEISGEGNHHEFKFREYDPRIGKFWSVDPRADKYPGWSPFNYVLNNPIINIDPIGDTVRVYTETVEATRNLARHAFIRVTTDKADWIVELWGPNDNEAANGTGRPRFDLVTDNSQIWGRKNVKEHEVTRPENSPEGNMDFENKILELGDFFSKCETTCTNGNEVPNFPNVPEYSATGPNSNGFVNFIIQQSGGDVMLPWNAIAKDDLKAYFDKLYPSGSMYKFTVTDEALK